MLENLTDRLQLVVKTIRGQARFTEKNISDAMREVRIALIEADVALPVIKYFIDRVKDKALGAEVSRISFGGASLSGEGAGYGFGNISSNESIDLLHKSIDFGINIIDTAPIYGFGESEIRIGKAIKDRREKVSIISKSGVTWHENMRVDMTNNPKVALFQLEESLRRLNTDYIDIYMVHWPDKNIDLLETLEVYITAQKAGKIKHIGLCNTTNAEIIKAKEVCNIDVLQSEVNLFNNHISNLDNSQDAVTMSWGTFDKGIITGSVTRIENSRSLIVEAGHLGGKKVIGKRK